MVKEKLYIAWIHIHTILDYTASTFSSEEIAKIKQVFFYSKTWNVELSAFATKNDCWNYLLLL